VQFANFGNPAPSDGHALREEFAANPQLVMSVLNNDQALLDYLADTLVEIGDSVPADIPSFKLGAPGNPFRDERLYDYQSYPDALFDLYTTTERTYNRNGYS
jgi:hypothetical protein